MIDIDISQALLHPGTPMPFSWKGSPAFTDPGLAGPVTIAGTICMDGEVLRLSALLETALSLHCDRCLAPVQRPVHETVDEIFMLSPAEGEAYAYDRETKRISLDQMIYDVLSVDIPLQVLCSDTCEGLCPQCGKNLNEGPCDCSADDDHAISQNNPFAKLKDLF